MNYDDPEVKFKEWVRAYPHLKGYYRDQWGQVLRRMKFLYEGWRRKAEIDKYRGKSYQRLTDHFEWIGGYLTVSFEEHVLVVAPIMEMAYAVARME